MLFQNLDKLTELKKEAEVTLKNKEDENRVNMRELKADQRALKVQGKEQNIRHADYIRALNKDNNKKASGYRQEYERIANEIKTKYSHKMELLRNEMNEKRKQIIQAIEKKKNEKISALTDEHLKRYNDIKNYYQEITNTNLDLIKQQKDLLAEAKKDDANKYLSLIHI